MCYILSWHGYAVKLMILVLVVAVVSTANRPEVCYRDTDYERICHNGRNAYDAPAGAGDFYRKNGYTEVKREPYNGTPLIYFEHLVTSRENDRVAPITSIASFVANPEPDAG